MREYLPVKPEKNEVSLIVKCGDLTAHKLWIMRKQSSKQPADGVTESSREVVKDDFRDVFRWVLTSSLVSKNRSKG